MLDLDDLTYDKVIDGNRHSFVVFYGAADEEAKVAGFFPLRIASQSCLRPPGGSATTPCPMTRAPRHATLP